MTTRVTSAHTAPDRSRTIPNEDQQEERRRGYRRWRRQRELNEIRTKLNQINTRLAMLKMREKALEDLILFGREICGFRDLNNNLHRDVAEFIDSSDAVVVLLPREHLKSSLITVARTCQLIAKNPDVRIALYSVTQDLSTTFLRQIKSILRSPAFQRYYGDRVSPDFVKDTVDTLQIQRSGGVREPTVYATSVGASQTGQHFDHNVYDDIVDGTTVQTKAALEKTWRWFQESLALHDKGSRLIYVGTRWHDDDVAGRLLRDKSYRHMVRSVEEGGIPIFPEKFTKDRIAKLRQRMSAYIFSCQYLNDPVPRENQTFLEEWLRDWNGDLPDGLTYLACDPALGKAKGDRSVIAVARVDTNRIIICDLWVGHPNPAGLIEIYLDMCERWQPTGAGIEANALQEFLYRWLRDVMERRRQWYGITPMGGNRRHKEEAILSLEPFFRGGRFHIWENCPHRSDLIHEMVRWPSGRYDDMLDCLAFLLEMIRFPSEEPEPEPYDGNRFVRQWFKEKEKTFWTDPQQVLGIHNVRSTGGAHATL